MAGVLGIVFACNSDKPSPFATKSSAAGSATPAGSAAAGSAAGSAAPASGSAAVATGSGSTAFKVGDSFWSLWGNGFAYSGKVLAINDDGSYQVQWDGQGRNDHWDANRALREKPAENPIKVGERAWTTPDMWEDNHARQGEVLRINANGTYRLSYADTDDSDVAKEYLRRDKPVPPPVTGLQVGDRVDGLWSDNRWYPGKVGAVNADGTYLVNFDDGDKAALDGHHLRRRKATTGGGGSSKAAGGEPCPEGPGWTRCKDWGCQKLSSSNQHCGSCSNSCRGDQTCNNGVCGCHSYEHLDENGRCSS